MKEILTQCKVAGERLQCILNGSKVTSWNDIPHFGCCPGDSAGGYNGYGKIAYTFRSPYSKGKPTMAAKVITTIGDHPGLTPSVIRHVVGMKDGWCVSLFESLRLWMLVTSIKGRYYLTNTGLTWCHEKMGITYYKTTYYDWFSLQLVTRNCGLKTAPGCEVIRGNSSDEAELTKAASEYSSNPTAKQPTNHLEAIRAFRAKDIEVNKLSRRIEELRKAKIAELRGLVKVDIPEGLTEEELRLVLDLILEEYFTE